MRKNFRIYIIYCMNYKKKLKKQKKAMYGNKII
jgi:hypothetical protein